VIQVLMGIFGELLGIDYKKKIKESVNWKSTTLLKCYYST
jgi:hypothetical protein